jgi:hypothetical protein
VFAVAVEEKPAGRFMIRDRPALIKRPALNYARLALPAPAKQT